MNILHNGRTVGGVSAIENPPSNGGGWSAAYWYQWGGVHSCLSGQVVNESVTTAKIAALVCVLAGLVEGGRSLSQLVVEGDEVHSMRMKRMLGNLGQSGGMTEAQGKAWNEKVHSTCTLCGHGFRGTDTTDEHVNAAGEPCGQEKKEVP